MSNSVVKFALALGLCVPSVASAQILPVPNGSFESPDVSGEIFFAGPVIDSWEKTPEPPGYNPANDGGDWFQKTGVFFNVPNPVPIAGVDGFQAAFITSFPGSGFFQDYDSAGGTNTTPSHEFEASYVAGKAYCLKVGLATSTSAFLQEGATLDLRLYYRDAASNRLTVAQSTVTYSTNLFTNAYQLLDFQLITPAVNPGDPWAGKRLGIEFVSNVPTNLAGGFWDLDHVRLLDFVSPTLTEPVWSDGSFQFTLLSEPGRTFALLASSDATLPLHQWTSEGLVTNVTGVLAVNGFTATNAQRFYAVQQVP